MYIYTWLPVWAVRCVLQINKLPAGRRACVRAQLLMFASSRIVLAAAISHRLNGHAIYCPRCMSPIKSMGKNTDATVSE
jgi:hypothetical protein